MSEPFIGQIVMFAGNFAPRGWAFCQGQIMSIAQNTALFSILGTTYGGNGQTTFALPDLRGRVPAGTGQGPGLPDVTMGEMAGSPSVTLTINNLPAHNHLATFMGTGAGEALSASVNIPVANTGATDASPVANVLAQSQQPGRTPIPVNSYAAASSANGTLAGATAAISGSPWFTGGNVAVGVTGSNIPVDNMPPYLGINYIIAVQGIFPSRN